MSECKIYIITNKINKKVYIGQTWKTIEKRFKEHKYCKYDNKLFRAMNKYGRDNFDIKIIDTCNMQEQADFLEDMHINQYNSIVLGYNIRSGGSRGLHSKETKEKMSLSHLGKIHSIETKQKMSDSQIGRKHSSDTIIKMSDQKLGEKHPRAKLTWEIVNKIRLDYASDNFTYRDLAAKYNTDYSSVGKIINNKIWKI